MGDDVDAVEGLLGFVEQPGDVLLVADVGGHRDGLATGGTDVEWRAQTRLAELAADAIAPRPWRPAPVPPSASDLAQFALWRSDDLDDEDLLHALTLLPAARAEVEGLEAGLLFTARSAGLTWAQIAKAIGFRSPQACQQHYTRLTARQDDP